MRAIPSPAYRLALAAVDEVDAAISLVGGLERWDFAGGHALILGAGLVLLDLSGEVIDYREQRVRRLRWRSEGSRGKDRGDGAREVGKESRVVRLVLVARSSTLRCSHAPRGVCLANLRAMHWDQRSSSVPQPRSHKIIRIA